MAVKTSRRTTGRRPRRAPQPTPSPTPSATCSCSPRSTAREALAGYLDSHAEPSRPEPLPEAEKTASPSAPTSRPSPSKASAASARRRPSTCRPAPASRWSSAATAPASAASPKPSSCCVTGDTYRWAKRAKVWREGWRNLHHKPAAIEAEFLVEGEKGPTVRRHALGPTTPTSPPPRPSRRSTASPGWSLAELGWKEALVTYRPVPLLQRAGLDARRGPVEALRRARRHPRPRRADRRRRRRWPKPARPARRRTRKRGRSATRSCGLLRADGRRPRPHPRRALEKKDWGLDAVEAVLAQAVTGSAAPRATSASSASSPTCRARRRRRSPPSSATCARPTSASAGHGRHARRDVEGPGRHPRPGPALPHRSTATATARSAASKAALDGPWHEHQAKEVEAASATRRAKRRTPSDAADAAPQARSALPVARGRTSLAQATGIGLDAAAGHPGARALARRPRVIGRPRRPGRPPRSRRAGPSTPPSTALRTAADGRAAAPRRPLEARRPAPRRLARPGQARPRRAPKPSSP